MKLEVGKFVRNKDGTIGKIIAIDLAKPRQEKYPNHPSKRWWRDKILISCYKGWRTTQNIIKASYNIINLIEVGDYLNGFRVNKIERYKTNTIIKIGNSTFNVLENEEIYTPSNDNNNGYEKIEKLKSVVTKEQMEQMAYKVGE